jgi:hypothetical protein
MAVCVCVYVCLYMCVYMCVYMCICVCVCAYDYLKYQKFNVFLTIDTGFNGFLTSFEIVAVFLVPNCMDPSSIIIFLF